MNILITICARGGSKGIPRKNIRSVGGKPLIAYSISHATAFAEKFGCDIALSTEDEEIISVAAAYGLSTEYLRPAELASDTAGKIPVLQDVLFYEEQRRSKRYDYLLDLDVSGPIRTMEDLEQGLAMMEENKNAYNLFSVSKAGKNPYFNMVEAKENGYYGLVKKPSVADGHVFSRQAAPEVYELNASFYFYRRNFFTDRQPSAITDRSLVYVMPHLCFDLDHMIDFEFLSFLLAEKKVKI